MLDFFSQMFLSLNLLLCPPYEVQPEQVEIFLICRDMGFIKIPEENSNSNPSPEDAPPEKFTFQEN